MSHIVTAKTQLIDQQCVATAVEKLQWQARTGSVHNLYGSQKAHGIGIDAPGWAYPIVVAEDGTVSYDTFCMVAPGKETDIERLQQYYALAVVEKTAVRQGHSITCHSVRNSQNREVLKVTVNC